ncbi:MAG TPA: hydrogenase maturation protease [Bacteroidales bacterium]|nr:hydrogenase maturation protease [Bacteroidales bacterium]HOU30372.1 hydrogenase maturation protease [Bacteroidales bacterium]HPP93155.1 hydrogenase maturation protease [Bacteroidales bacterium]HQG56806.1 hydrogenase maturation protease [Bacteroidales bacterium]HQK71224.1 hydrogenase maturation protease [Bacteroidales bacterium]
MIPDLQKLLSQPGKKILFVGIGNLLKSDDGAGVYISRRIRETENISALTVEMCIENYIGKINSLQPDILVLIDCADMGEPPGTIKLLKLDEIKDFTTNTHNISLKKISDFFNAQVFILGIQPLSVAFGEKISYIVARSAKNIIKQINNYKTIK